MVEICTRKHGLLVKPNLDYYKPQSTIINYGLIFLLRFLQDFELVFNSPFRIEVDVDEGCSYDYLEIYGPGGSYPIYGPLCGNEPPEPLEFSGEVMVYFHSDASVRQRGFSADYGPPGTVGYEEVGKKR